MGRLVRDFTELVGGTPLLEVSRFGAARGFPGGCCASWST